MVMVMLRTGLYDNVPPPTGTARRESDASCSEVSSTVDMALTRVGCHVRRAGMAMAMGMPFCMRRASRQRIIHIAYAITSVTRAYVTRSTKIETCAIWQLAHGLVLSAVVRAVRRL